MNPLQDSIGLGVAGCGWGDYNMRYGTCQWVALSVWHAQPRGLLRVYDTRSIIGEWTTTAPDALALN